MEDDLEFQRFLEAKGLTINTILPKRRCLFATRDFIPGEVIMREEPYVCMPTCSEPLCQRCFKSDGALLKCASCNIAWYCGAECQRLDWKLHKLECRAISRLEKKWQELVTPEIRLLVKLFIRRKLQCDKVIPTTPIDNYSLVEAMIAHRYNMEAEKVAAFEMKAEIVKQMLQQPRFNLDEAVNNFCKVSCNALAILDIDMEQLGIGLYPVMSIINHSCLPNAVLVFEGKLAVLRALLPVEKGDEYFVSYIDLSRPTRHRQNDLNAKYHFLCLCHRCRKFDEIDDQILDALKCKHGKCDGFLVDKDGFYSRDQKFECSKCGRVRTSKTEKKAKDKLEPLLVKGRSHFADRNFQEALSTYKRVEEATLDLYHPSSFSVMIVRNLLTKLYMKTGDIKAALECCRLTTSGHERLLQREDPVLGLHYYARGMLEWAEGNKEESLNYLNKAANILRITHGTNFPFVEELLINLAKEQEGGPSGF
ncbi:LOW QUALITY PROTEIN: histone-lysine N-methyltransferase ASHR1-like [Herrania umbratica]|uniref:LOW QUALITY PROTEIN: histone-lysine N-methyltransferase ASHR1-like n=1 Tax=Herrania umbratica TaxID=108875 RepID=A0A6J1AEB3_9ROSI|nr:LOW QUALITY PROTEIN: histone-lysine N-methyltransferase ASHR1-like [Herrania umbratica]